MIGKKGWEGDEEFTVGLHSDIHEWISYKFVTVGCLSIRSFLDISFNQYSGSASSFNLLFPKLKLDIILLINQVFFKDLFICLFLL